MAFWSGAACNAGNLHGKRVEGGVMHRVKDRVAVPSPSTVDSGNDDFTIAMRDRGMKMLTGLMHTLVLTM
jgi:hypothetical protein